MRRSQKVANVNSDVFLVSQSQKSRLNHPSRFRRRSWIRRVEKELVVYNVEKSIAATPCDCVASSASASRQMQDRIPKRIIQTGKHAQQPLRSRAVMSNIK